MEEECRRKLAPNHVVILRGAHTGRNYPIGAVFITTTPRVEN